ncbi:MAG: LysR family transcriptional regulator, partial [Sneathiella sp.]|nr:LysR family transcriptional regulator [Sneathiella sp.]
MPVSPLRPKGPPLNALRAFEAAARLGGFSLAAEELCVTPGAIAQHIKAVEAWVGVPLFERRSQGVALTAVGVRVLPDFIAAFDRLGAAVHNLKTKTAPQDISIATLPSIAHLWLSPRLPAIRERTPNITISVTALENTPNMSREPYDLALFFEKLPINPQSISLGPDIIFPVCTPALAKRLQRLSDLETVPCLRDATWSGDWNLWLKSVAPANQVQVNGPSYSLYALAL